MRVCVLSTCRTAEALTGNTLLFRTLRTGFPTARVCVYDNGSPADLSCEIERLAKLAGCEFVYGTEQLHGDWLKRIVDAADPDEPLIFLDPDVVLWKDCGPLVEWVGDALFAGRYIRRIRENGAVQEPRIHPSFLIIPNPGRLREAIAAEQAKTWYFDPFHPYTYARDGVRVIVDTAASLYSVLGDLAKAFDPEQLDHYDHLFAGTMLADHAAKGMHKETHTLLSRVHAMAAEEDLEPLRGIWREQEKMLSALAGETQPAAIPGPVASWTYLSGTLTDQNGEKWGVASANFMMDGKFVTSHVSLTDVDGQKFYFTENAHPQRPLVVSHQFENGPRIMLEIKPTTSIVEHASQRGGHPTAYYSAPRAMCSGTIVLDGENLAVVGGLWMDYEELPAALVRGWDWLSLRLDGGERLMIYTPHVGDRFGTLSLPDGTARHLEAAQIEVDVVDSYMSEGSCNVYPHGWTVRVPGLPEMAVAPVLRDQELHATGTSYWEGLCDVTVQGKRVGHAFAELAGYVEPTELQMGTRWARGDKSAVDFMWHMASGSQIADDFVDDDVKPDERSKTMAGLLMLCFGSLPNNTFYQKYRTQLEPVILTSLIAWDASNDWAKSRHRETRMFGYVHTEALEQVAVMIALLVGGYKWARKVRREISIFYHGPKNCQPFDAWEAEKRCA